VLVPGVQHTRDARAVDDAPSDGTSPIIRVGSYAALLLLVMLVVVTSSSSLTNADTFFHLRIGQEFSTGRWSLTHPGHFNQFGSKDWLPTQWLGEIWLYRFDQWFGLGGVAWLAGAWQLALMTTVLLICRRQAAPVVAITVTALTLLTSHASLSPRPQVLSYILIGVVVHAWLRTEEDGRARWWLVPLTWVWAMLHGMWLLGVVTSFVAAFGLALADTRDLRARWRHFGVPVGMALAAAVTPVGPGLYAAVALVGQRSDLFSEWKPADYTTPFNAILAIMLIATIGLAVRAKESSWVRLGLILLSAAWALYSARTVPIAAVTLAPLLSYYLTSHVSPHGRMTRTEKVTLTTAVCVALVTLSFTARDAGQIHEPSWVRPQLNALPAHTPVLADMAISGYLVWAYPNVSPPITGYGDMYTNAELDRFNKMLNLSAGWDDDLRRLGIRWALIDPKSPMAYALTRGEHWRTVATSKDVVLLTSTTEATAGAGSAPSSTTTPPVHDSSASG
jgi:hypothetical protein